MCQVFSNGGERKPSWKTVLHVSLKTAPGSDSGAGSQDNAIWINYAVG